MHQVRLVMSEFWFIRHGWTVMGTLYFYDPAWRRHSAFYWTLRQHITKLRKATQVEMRAGGGGGMRCFWRTVGRRSIYWHCGQWAMDPCTTSTGVHEWARRPGAIAMSQPPIRIADTKHDAHGPARGNATILASPVWPAHVDQCPSGAVKPSSIADIACQWAADYWRQRTAVQQHVQTENKICSVADSIAFRRSLCVVCSFHFAAKLFLTHCSLITSVVAVFITNELKCSRVPVTGYGFPSLQ